MWPNHQQALFASLLWFATITIIYFWGERWLQHQHTHRFLHLNAWHLFSIAVLVRLLPALLLPFGARYDIDSYQLVADAIRRQEDVYMSASVAGRYPYLPLLLYWFAAASWLSEHLVLPFVVWVKLPAILADGGIILLLYRAVRTNLSEHSRSQAVLVALLYAFNPISLLVTAYHGQFDAIPVFALLWSWYEWERGRKDGSAAAFGLAILSKTWPVLLLPVFLIPLAKIRVHIRFLFIIVIIPLGFVGLYLLLFNGSLHAIFLGRPFTHRGVLGYWGISGLLALGQLYWPDLSILNQHYLTIGQPLMLMGVLLAYWRTRHQPIHRRILVILLMVFALTPGIGIQWLMWLLPFGLLVQDNKERQIYLLGSLLYLVSNLYGLHFSSWLTQITSGEWLKPILILTTWPPWIIILIWLGRQWFRQQSRSPVPDLLSETNETPEYL